MSAAMSAGARVRHQARARVREAALDAARVTVLASGWGAVRMGAVAAQSEVSRQTLHAHFGTKDDLGRELVLRETSAFFEAVTARLDEWPGEDPVDAVAGAAEIALRMVAANPLLQTVLGATDEDHGLLPLVTSRSEPLIARGTELFGAWVAVRLPSLDPEAAEVMVESVVRLLISHAVVPSREPEVAARDLALVLRAFREVEGPGGLSGPGGS